MSFITNWESLNSRIDSLNPKKSVQIIVVSKTRSISEIKDAIHSGVYRFGENKIQEALSKFPNLESLSEKLELHHIGPVQSGTLKKLFGNFQFTHGVCSIKSLAELSKQSEKSKQKLKFFIQMNLTGESTKHGFSKEDFQNHFSEIQNLETEFLEFHGLMCMGPTNEDIILTRKVFKELNQMRNEFCPEKKVSMGMSGDYEIAVEENTDYIRVGSLLFGPR